MKSSRSTSLQYKNAERKGNKREKAPKLDRKSSRGMIFENEELRLRTININAEVERGQTDIKRLRRENDQLKREIWTLRDECDRLNKRINIKLLDHERCNCNVRGSGGSSGCTRCPSQSNTDDSDSCDTCKGGDDCDDGHCSDECCQMPTIKQQQQHQQQQHQQNKQNMGMDMAKTNNVDTVYPKFSEPQHLHNTFDHLSVVSEETLSNSEVQASHHQQQQQQLQHHHQQQQQGQQNNVAYTPSVNGSQTTLPSLMGQLTPLTPIELVANQLNDLQAVVPPLSYFENIIHDHMGSTIGMTPDTACISPSKKIIKHTNGWDYNLQSPFAQRRPSPASSTSSPSSASTRSPTIKLRYPPGPSTVSTLTTFVPTTGTSSTIVNAADGRATYNSNINNDIAHTNVTPVIETVAITTMPTTAPPPPPTLGSPKHFFSPLKPRLKINTSLANKNSTIPAPPVVPTTATSNTQNGFQNCDPPDIYVTNALASPYKRPPLPPTTTTTTIQSPQLPQHSMNGSNNYTNSSSSNSTSPPNTESVNLETILNDIEHISEDILAIQLEKKNQNGIGQNRKSKSLQLDDKNKKPYRSEMNLQLCYDGVNPTIKPAVTSDQLNKATVNEMATNGIRTRARSLERETTESPSPKIPDAMPAFPNNRTYIGFDQFNKAAIRSPQQGRRTIPAISKSNISSPQRPPPPAPPIRLGPPPLNVRNVSLPSVNGTPTTPQLIGNEPMIGGQALTPNKSHLYKAVANATAKRAQFRLESPTLSRSLDLDLAQNIDLQLEATPDVTTQISEAARRKARRVSIVCGETPSTPEVSPTAPVISMRNSILSTTQPVQLSTGSCINLTATPTNPLLQSLKQVTSHSTPNSPHSARRRSNNGLSPADLANHQHQRSNSSNTGSQHRRSSQDSMREQNGTATVTPVATRSRCLRRHSDGTVAVGNTQRISGTSGGHHHHHHHHHQHSSSLVSNSHHIRHSHQDSNQETGSGSDRNSNSFGSSRESSTSFSMRSQRRKISVSSHTGGKIPWCGCWGNGCL